MSAPGHKAAAELPEQLAAKVSPLFLQCHFYTDPDPDPDPAICVSDLPNVVSMSAPGHKAAAELPEQLAAKVSTLFFSVQFLHGSGSCYFRQ
jgi:hypothetical protein